VLQFNLLLQRHIVRKQHDVQAAFQGAPRELTRISARHGDQCQIGLGQDLQRTIEADRPDLTARSGFAGGLLSRASTAANALWADLPRSGLYSDQQIGVARLLECGISRPLAPRMAWLDLVPITTAASTTLGSAVSC